MVAGWISSIFQKKKHNHKRNPLTVLQFLEKLKYNCDIAIIYYSTTIGCEITDYFPKNRYWDVIDIYGNRVVNWFYITESAKGTLYIDVS